MAYNPFDDVIDQDPAYMQTGGGTPTTDQKPNVLQSALKPVQKVGEFLEPGLMYAGEAMMNAPYQFGKLLDTDKTTKERYQETMQDPKSFVQGLKTFMIPVEALGEGLTYLFNPQDIRETRLKLSTGEATPIERIGAQVGATFELLGAGELFKIIGRKYGPDIVNSLQKQNFKSNQEIINALPVSGKEKVEFAKEIYGGMGLPSKPPGMETSQILSEPNMGGSSAANLARLENIQKLNTEQVPKLEKFYNDNEEKFLGKGIDFFVKEAKKQKIIPETYLGMATISGTSGLVRVAPDLSKKVKDYQLPNYVLKEVDFTSEMSPQDQFVKKYSDSYFEITGRRPTKRELINHIIDKGSPDAKSNLQNITTLDKSPGFIRNANPEYIKLSKQNITIDNYAKTNPGFASDLEIAKANLKASDAKAITIKNEYEKLMKPFDDANQERPFGYNSFTQYIRGKDDIPKRQKTLDLDTYEPPYASQKKGQRAYNRISKSLTSKFNDITGSLPRFLTAKYRSLMTQQGKNISDKDFMEKYVEPFVVYEDGSKKVNTEATLQKFRNEYENFPKWEKMENRVTRYNSILNDFMDRLAIDGQYDERQLKLIKSQLEPQRSHEFKISQMMKDSRFINLSDNPDLIRIQPKVINVVYQPVYDNIIRKILNQFENVNDIAELKAAKTKALTIGKKNLKNTDITVSPKDYQNQFDYLSALYKQVNENMNERGMTGLYDFNPKNKDVIKGLNFELDNTLGELIKVGSAYNSPEDYFKRMDLILDKLGLEKMKGNKFYKYEKGGAVKMAKGGLDSVLENMNQQNFTPDPAIDGDSAFQQAVKSGNLTAFNIPKVFKTLGDTFGVFTPKRASAPTATTAEGVDAGTALGAPPGQTLPATKPLQSEDFVFESFTLDKINSPTAPKAAKPQDWINYLQGGKDKAPSAELLDSGLFQYMADFEKFFPNQKMTKQQIVELYEQSPIANLKIKVKIDDRSSAINPIYGDETQNAMGTARHRNAGNAQIDAGGTDYREIVLEAGPLPGEQKSFVNSTHFNEDNVLVFSRVANYDNKAGERVAVIQELQTDLLTKVRKEQERLNSIIENKKLQVQRNNDILQNPNRDNYDRAMATENLTRLVPELNQLEKVKETNLISPYPMTVAKDLIPTYQKQLNDVQQEINTLIRSGIDRSDPEFLMKISELEAQQQKVLDDLLNLNRTSNFDELTKGIKVPSTSESEQLVNIAQGRDNYMSMKDLETFPPIPFNKQPDYVDLIIKATIKDAEARGINKVAIMPADIGANPRWGKTTLQMDREDKSSGDKFRNLYDKVGVQQLKNIAKKYGGQLNIEEIIDPQKSNLGLTFSTRNIEGTGFNFMKELDVDQGAISRGDLGPANRFLNEEILRMAQEMGPNEVVYRKETAPGQTMDYFVKIVPDQLTGVDNFDLVPLKAGDDALDARILIEDRDPSAIKMYTITLPEKTKDKPFFLFRKKEGGKIPGDRLVSITDIYGDY